MGFCAAKRGAPAPLLGAVVFTVLAGCGYFFHLSWDRHGPFAFEYSTLDWVATLAGLVAVVVLGSHWAHARSCGWRSASGPMPAGVPYDTTVSGK
jgi:hypothetical protein